MSRHFISTGEIGLGEAKRSKNTRENVVRDEAMPFHILVLSELSGNSEGSAGIAGFQQAKIVELDRDNFEEIFRKFNVSLNLPFCEESIAFREFDDLHPDYIIERVELFDQLNKLERKLRRKTDFAEAAREIRQWKDYQEPLLIKPETTHRDFDPNAEQPEKDSSTLFDEILTRSSSGTNESNTSNDNIESLIKNIVAPFVSEKEDPELEPMLESVRRAKSALLRRVLHSAEFQRLEATWRSLYLLVRRVSTNRKLKIFVANVPKNFLLAATLENGEDEQANIIYQLIRAEGNIPGGVPFALTLADYNFEDSIEDVKLLRCFASAAAEIGGAIVARANLKFAGCENLVLQHDASAWDYRAEPSVNQAWASLRAERFAEHLALAAPRFLIRLPYGMRTSPIESFKFEELEQAQHTHYLWGNGAYLIVILLANLFDENGWSIELNAAQTLSQLPLHAYTNDGEEYIVPCAEAYIDDAIVNKLAETGIISIRSVKNRDEVMIPKFRSISLTGFWRGFWQ